MASGVFLHSYTLLANFFIIAKRSLGDAAGDAAGPRGDPFPPMPPQHPPPGHFTDGDGLNEPEPPWNFR